MEIQHLFKIEFIVNKLKAFYVTLDKFSAFFLNYYISSYWPSNFDRSICLVIREFSSYVSQGYFSSGIVASGKVA